jgi:type IX secretion system PorP/SprF family membrane protein
VILRDQKLKLFHFLISERLRALSCLYFIIVQIYILPAQDITLFKNYSYNNLYNVNPAAAGFDGAFISDLSVTKKWVGMNGSPCGQVFSNSLRLGEEDFYDPNMLLNRPMFQFAPRVGVGLSVFNESSGPLRHTGMLFAYAYHIPLRENRLSFGISGILTQYHLNVEEFRPSSEDDPSLYTNPKAFVPDVNFGVMYYNRHLYSGLSVNGILKFNTEAGPKKNYPDLVIYGGYKFPINQNFKFEPSLFIMEYGHGSLLTDFNLKAYYLDKNWLSLSYKANAELEAAIGLTIKKGIQLIYSYGVSTTGMASYSAGSQSISIQFDVAALEMKHKTK